MAGNGVNRKIVADITKKKLRGKALADALAAALNAEQPKT